jgi:CRISPR-associated protein Cas2
MVEFQAGVFVGNLPARVRDRLWEKIVQRETRGSAILIYRANTEQGFAVRCHGEPTRTPVDYDGITLMRFTGAKKGA